MKTTGMLSAKNIFGMIAAASFLTIASSAAAVGFQAATSAQPAFEHCGCDTQKGIEMYVQNLINDAKKRGLSCESSLHIPACITTYCSICKGHEGLVENCIKAGVEYFSNSSDLCSSQQAGVTYMPDMKLLNQFIN